MFIRFSKEGSSEVTVVSNVHTCRPLFKNEKFIGFQIIAEKKTDNKLGSFELIRGTDFDDNWFEVIQSAEEPTIMGSDNTVETLKSMLHQAGINPSDYDSFEEFLNDVKKSGIFPSLNKKEKTKDSSLDETVFEIV